MNTVHKYSNPYSVIAVANEILKRANAQGIEVSHLKLQKLVYYSHAWSLVFFDRPLIMERVEAWQYGPVIPALFEKCSKWKGSIINDHLYDGDQALFFSPDDTSAHAVVDKILEVYGRFSPGQLSTLAHSPDSAWGLTKGDHFDGMRKNYPLPNKLIKLAEGEILKNSKCGKA